MNTNPLQPRLFDLSPFLQPLVPGRRSVSRTTHRGDWLAQVFELSISLLVTAGCGNLALGLGVLLDVVDLGALLERPSADWVDGSLKRLADVVGARRWVLAPLDVVGCHTSRLVDLLALDADAGIVVGGARPLLGPVMIQLILGAGRLLADELLVLRHLHLECVRLGHLQHRVLRFRFVVAWTCLLELLVVLDDVLDVRAGLAPRELLEVVSLGQIGPLLMASVGVRRWQVPPLAGFLVDECLLHSHGLHVHVGPVHELRLECSRHFLIQVTAGARLDVLYNGHILEILTLDGDARG